MVWFVWWWTSCFHHGYFSCHTLWFSLLGMMLLDDEGMGVMGGGRFSIWRWVLISRENAPAALFLVVGWKAVFLAGVAMGLG